MRKTADQQLVVSAFMVAAIYLCVIEVFFIRNPFAFALAAGFFLVTVYFAVTPGLRMFAVCAWRRDWKCCRLLIAGFMVPEPRTGFPRRRRACR